MPDSLFIPIIDNGMRLSRTTWAASMFGLGISGALGNRRVAFDHFSHPDPCATMNTCTHMFMQSGCDRMLVIDTDHIFRPEDVARLLSHDLELVSGLYPKKTKEPEWPIYPLNDAKPSEMFADGAPALIEVQCVPRGFLSIHRSVFEKLRDVVPTAKMDAGEKSESLRLYWQSIPGVTSEDFAFCDLWRANGGKVWLDHTVRVLHEGSCIYPQ